MCRGFHPATRVLDHCAVAVTDHSLVALFSEYDRITIQGERFYYTGNSVSLCSPYLAILIESIIPRIPRQSSPSVASMLRTPTLDRYHHRFPEMTDDD